MTIYAVNMRSGFKINSKSYDLFIVRIFNFTPDKRENYQNVIDQAGSMTPLGLQDALSHRKAAWQYTFGRIVLEYCIAQSYLSCHFSVCYWMHFISKCNIYPTTLSYALNKSYIILLLSDMRWLSYKKWRLRQKILLMLHFRVCFP